MFLFHYESGKESVSYPQREGLQNTIRCNLIDAVGIIPRQDWEAEIRTRQKEGDGQTLIWLEERSEPSYSIQE